MKVLHKLPPTSVLCSLKILGSHHWDTPQNLPIPEILRSVPGAMYAVAANQVFQGADKKIRVILASDTAPEKYTQLLDALQVHQGGRGIVSRIMDVCPSAVCFDSMCCYLMENPTGHIETPDISIRKQTGLIIDDDDYDDGIPVTVNQPNDIETGYL